MPPVLLANTARAMLRYIYEKLRDSGAYDVDWLDRLGWKIFTAFVLILLLA